MTFVSAVLSNSFKSRIASLFSMNLSRLFHCSVIKVLCSLPFSNFYILPDVQSLVNNFFYFFEILFSVIHFCLFKPLLCSPHLSATNVILSCLFLIVNTFYIFYFICTIGTICLPIAIISYLLSLKD